MYGDFLGCFEKHHYLGINCCRYFLVTHSNNISLHRFVTKDKFVPLKSQPCRHATVGDIDLCIDTKTSGKLSRLRICRSLFLGKRSNLLPHEHWCEHKQSKMFKIVDIIFNQKPCQSRFYFEILDAKVSFCRSPDSKKVLTIRRIYLNKRLKF